MDYSSSEEIANGLILSGISVQVQCHCAKVVIIPLRRRDKKFSLRRANIKITNSLFKSDCPKHNLYCTIMKQNG